jgi:serine/threonine-protein kinase HipA
MTSELIALADNYEVGRITRNRKGKLSLVYNDDWREDSNAYPISLSMPLTAKEHGHEKIDSFLWGLLPDNQRILESWARRFRASAGSAFALIACVGEDCAGAVQFVTPERLSAVRNGTASEVAWIDEHEIAERLKRLVVDHAAWRIERDTGQFSLAGAQPKTAFLFDNDRWGVPSGRVPTTHIFKPPLADYDGHAENEHFCLRLAAKFGLLVTESRVMRFEDQIAIVVTRYDRIRTADGLKRVHQEDMCQANGLRPSLKYQAEGGPGPVDIIRLIDSYSINPIEDRQAFVDAVALNWLVGGSDAHAKNYSVLIGSGGDARLAPLYDVASALPYDNIDQKKLTLAMRIGGEYRLADIRLREWQKFASELNLNADELLIRLRHLTESMPDLLSETRQNLMAEGLTHNLIDSLARRLTGRARNCARILEVGSPTGAPSSSTPSSS